MTHLPLPAPEPTPGNSALLITTPDSTRATSSASPAASAPLALPAPPAPLALPAPSNASPADPQQELEWKGSLKNLEYHIEAYKDRAKEGKASEREVEEVAKAMEQVANAHTDPKVKTHWRERAGAFRTASAKERDGILEEIGKGFLMLLTTPFFLVGAVLQGVGGILDGVGFILKGLGRLSRKLTYTGGSKRGQQTEDAEST